MSRDHGHDRLRSLTMLAREVDPQGPEAPEFAPGVDERPSIGRRDLGRLLGASLMLAAMPACTRAPKGRIVAYGRGPEQTPGVSQAYATTMTVGGYGTGLVVEEHDGRPTKIEGNPDHPASLGGSGIFEQAALLALYDPDRLASVREGGAVRSFAALAQAMSVKAGSSLARTHIVHGPASSPLLRALLASMEARGATVHMHDPLPRSNVWRGAELAFGQSADPVYDLSKAKVLVALDSDLLAAGPFHLRYARKFAEGRRIPKPDGTMSRLYVAEPTMTITGGVADHRLPVRRAEMVTLAAALVRETLPLLSMSAWGARVLDRVTKIPATPAVTRWVKVVARDLAAQRGRAVVVVGDAQPPTVHALAQLLNLALGGVGQTVRHVRPVTAPATDSGLSELLTEADRGRIDTVILVDGNPSYDAPADLDFSRRIRAIPKRVYLTQYANETARDATWLVPAAHFLESWGDARAIDGTVSFVQPMIEPLYGGKTPAELISALLGDQASGRDLLVEHWRKSHIGFDDIWPTALQRGVLVGTEAPDLTFDERSVAIDLDLSQVDDASPFELIFQADARVRDGEFTNNAWLLELPDPVSKLTWGNAVSLSAGTAAQLGVTAGDVVSLAVGGSVLDGPAIVIPGQADGTVGVTLGFGRRADSEQLSLGVGFDAYPLRTARHLWSHPGLVLSRTGKRESLAITQEHDRMEGRPIALDATLTDFRRNAALFAARNDLSPSLYDSNPLPNTAPQWAMAIDLNVCTGCSACVVACQAENNVPVVGKAGIEKGRAMHWLRIDRYFGGTMADPTVNHQPMACQHCEKAPCEYVCPVGATVHSADGLNEMVYNRCVGTRFCSNNCPYKVRRFNWFDYNRDKPETLRMAMNPDVTVRARGVMEKCSYCVQRIREVEIHSRARGAAIEDGEVRTACEQACPTRAITFGSIADSGSRVSALHRDPRAYAVLHELGTAPRTRYLARITNPNPELAT